MKRGFKIHHWKFLYSPQKVYVWYGNYVSYMINFAFIGNLFPFQDILWKKVSDNVFKLLMRPCKVYDRIFGEIKINGGVNSKLFLK